MVSYYNYPLAMYPKNHSGGPNPYAGSPSAAWYAQNYHQPPNAAQFLGDSDGPPQPVHYPHHMFHQASPDWTGHDAYGAPSISGSVSAASNNALGGPAGYLSINQATQNGNNHNEHINDGLQSLPSPPITVSGSDMSSPGAPNGTSSPRINSRPTPVKSPYEWINKPSYQSQPNPGKTRTKDKYRVVYTDHQRLELEKEFHYTKYITIRRKSELAQNLSLSERQVKIWFQNRRAKDRKHKKKMDTGVPMTMNGQNLSHSHNNINSSSISTSGYSSFADVKPKIDPSIHLQHLQQMTAMGLRIR